MAEYIDYCDPHLHARVDAVVDNVARLPYKVADIYHRLTN